MYGASERVMTDPTTPKVAEKKPVAVINEASAPSLPRTAVNVSDLMQLILPEDLFLGILCLERKRAERHTRKFVLVLIDAEGIKPKKGRSRDVKGLVRAANDARRETDPAGWYKQDSILGIIFTEVGELEDSAFTDRIIQKLRQSLTTHLSVEDVKHIRVSVHTFSEDSNSKDSDISGTPVLYPDLFNLDHTKESSFRAEAGDGRGGQRLRPADSFACFSNHRRGGEVKLERPGVFHAATPGPVGQAVHLPEIPFDVCE